MTVNFIPTCLILLHSMIICCSCLGIWNGNFNKVLYPYSANDRTPRTQHDYIRSGQEAAKRSQGRKEIAVDGIKGVFPLLIIFEYPSQVIYDFMHLVCLGHVPTLINRWCLIMSKESIVDIDQKLRALRFPRNSNVIFLESIKMVSQWKAKNCRLFILNISVPLMGFALPKLIFSHFVTYALAIKLLHASENKEEIKFGQCLIDYYCRTASRVYDPSIEIMSLHAHLHLADQVFQHGGLAHTSAFAFEAAIRFILKKSSWQCAFGLSNCILDKYAMLKIIEESLSIGRCFFGCK